MKSVNQFEKLTEFAFNLKHVKDHSGEWTTDDLLKIALDVAVHLKNSDDVSSKKNLVLTVVNVVSFVVEELVKSDPEKSKSLKEFVENSLPKALSLNSVLNNPYEYLKSFCLCCFFVNSVDKNAVEQQVEKV